MQSSVELKALPFQEAIDYFRSKGYKIGFSYQDIEPEAHATAFTVAKAMRTDLLQDIRAATDDAIAGGQTFDTFQQNLKPTLESKGWWGVKSMTDPLTGEEKDVQLGSARRLRTIYDTNMRTAFATGRWEQVQRTKKVLPYLRYVGMNDARERPEHKAWNDTVLPVDDPFWLQHYPPNGWGCRCTVQQVGAPDLDNLGLAVSEKAPASPMVNYMNARTGQTVRVPKGVDPSFGYNPGVQRMKAITPPPIDKPLDVPYAGDPAKVPMPKPRPVGKDMLLPDGLGDEEYVDKFLGAFGAGIGNPKIYTDVMKEPVVISDDLFRYGSGKWKIGKFLRSQYLPLLAETIQDPDEIWQVWEEYPKGRWTLRRKYISSYAIDDRGNKNTLAIFDTNPAGWSGITTFQTNDKNYAEKERRGTLVYRRPDEDGK